MSRRPAEDDSFCNCGPAAISGGLVAVYKSHVIISLAQLGVTMGVD